MHESSLEDRKTLFKLVYARDAFERTLSFGKAFQEYQNPDPDDPLYSSLSCSIFVNYAKPFKQGQVLKEALEENIPTEYELIHNDAIRWRDRFFAHTDTKGLTDDEGLEANQVCIEVENGKPSLIWQKLEVKSDFVSDLTKLSEILLEKTGGYIRELYKKHQNFFPKTDGIYLLNIDPKIDAFFTIKPPVI